MAQEGSGAWGSGLSVEVVSRYGGTVFAGEAERVSVPLIDGELGVGGHGPARQHHGHLGAARERVNLFFDVAEPTAQLGRDRGARPQRTAFCGTWQHRPDEREGQASAGQRDDLAGSENLSSTVVTIAVVTTHGRQQPLSLVVAQHPWTGPRMPGSFGDAHTPLFDQLTGPRQRLLTLTSLSRLSVEALSTDWRTLWTENFHYSGSRLCS